MVVCFSMHSHAASFCYVATVLPKRLVCIQTSGYPFYIHLEIELYSSSFEITQSCLFV